MIRKVLIFIAVAFVFAVNTMSAANTSDDVAKALIKLENDWAKAALAGDAAALDKILGPDYISTGSDGELVTRADTLAGLKSGQNKYSVFTVEDMKAYVYGDAAVVIGKGRVKGTEKGKAIDEEDRFTDTWINNNGTWVAVATHVSRIPKK
jgi:ketosteroid isomerase-like protein